MLSREIFVRQVNATSQSTAAQNQNHYRNHPGRSSLSRWRRGRHQFAADRLRIGLVIGHHFELFLDFLIAQTVGLVRGDRHRHHDRRRILLGLGRPSVFLFAVLLVVHGLFHFGGFGGFGGRCRNRFGRVFLVFFGGLFGLG